ncbi:MAG: hypothetical protein BMS9Abin34_209 [Patescibacteria group bacterium]|nr:MAG: hypothetical protein BMS9Abin34_209 [Patescibacteria group bacterium]
MKELEIFIAVWSILIVGFVLIFMSARVSGGIAARRRFRRIFGFDPPTKKDGDEGIRLLQPDVGGVLRQRAQAIEQEQNTHPVKPTPDYKLSKMRMLRQMRKEFSQIRTLAKYFGFETKPTIREYIN